MANGGGVGSVPVPVQWHFVVVLPQPTQMTTRGGRQWDSDPGSARDLGVGTHPAACCLIQQATASGELLGDAIIPVGMLKTCEPLGGYDELRLCGVRHGRSAAGLQLVSPCAKSLRPKARHRAEPSLLISPEHHGGISPVTPTNQGKPWSFTVIHNEKTSATDSQAQEQHSLKIGVLLTPLSQVLPDVQSCPITLKCDCAVSVLR